MQQHIFRLQPQTAHMSLIPNIHPMLCLQIHGDTLIQHSALLPEVERLQRKLRGTWLRLADLLMNVRCMVDFVSNTQA